MVTTTDATAPSSAWIGVALIRVLTLRPSGTESTTSSARTVSPAPSWLRQGELAQGHLAPVGAPARHHLQELLGLMPGRAQPFDDAPRLAIERRRMAGSRVEHHHADRRGLDQGLEVGASRAARRGGRAALAIADAAWEANSASTSSSSSVNCRAPALSPRKKWPTCTPRWRSGALMKVQAGRRGSGDKPSERT